MQNPQEEVCEFDEQTRVPYLTTEALLRNTAITPFQREKLFTFLMDATTKQFFRRETYALACFYIDLYFMRRNEEIQRDNFQNLGLAALNLAAKNNQSRLLRVNWEIFSKDEILQLESQIILELDLNLNPVTYVQQLDFLFQKWDEFSEKRNIYPGVKYFSSNINSYRKIKTTCQKMDCINLVAKIKRFQSKEVVLILFYLQNKVFCVPETSQNLINLQEVRNELLSDDDYKQGFNDFLDWTGIQTGLNEQIIDFIYPALTMKDSQPNITFTGFSVSLMTKNKGSSRIAVRIIENTRDL